MRKPAARLEAPASRAEPLKFPAMKAASTYLALILRHRPEAAGIALNAEGWARVDEVLPALRRRFGSFDREALDELVRSNDKQRYAFNDAGTHIRANQGHSIDVDLGLEQAAPPGILYHGTAARFLPSILAEGLVRRKRHHVHLSGDLETAQAVGARRQGETALLRVLSGRMAAEGHTFFRSSNGVWLTDHVPPAHLEPIGR